MNRTLYNAIIGTVLGVTWTVLSCSILHTAAHQTNAAVSADAAVRLTPEQEALVNLCVTMAAIYGSPEVIDACRTTEDVISLIGSLQTTMCKDSTL